MTAHQPPHWFRSIICCLAAFTVFWVLVAPATWMSGWQPWQQVLGTWATHAGHARIPVPRDIMTKWGPHPLVRFTHTLPSMVWASCAAIQVQGCGGGGPSARAMHRWSGRMMLFSSIMISIGYAVIDARKLISGDELEKSEVEEKGLLRLIDGRIGVRLLAAWFVTTAVATAAAARQAAIAMDAKERARLRAKHAQWALRHM